MTGRPRKFDRNQALVLAMECFWANGFTATSIADLTNEMGIRAPSLYAAFGNKENLFEEASALYYAEVSKNVTTALAQPTAGEAIAELLRISSEAYVDEATPPGCLLMSEPRLSSQREQLARTISERLQQGVEEGELLPEADTASLASFVLAVAVGMSRRARDGGKYEDLISIANTALAALPLAK
ncbi:TetR/AcrR family transcriptional regulator [Glutamicibacter arilaitensis]|uniref:TetR/AcrR family transcriptional regulator n=1 Tax=Glutamicibacter arilaitensis TaxID=256701 RepID=UPI003A91AC0D